MCDRERIEVVLADGQGVVRAGLAALLGAEPDIEVLGQAGDGAQAVRLYLKLHPHVLVLDLSLPGVDGVTVIREVLAADRRARILVLTTCDGDQDISRALKAGARGYLLKDAPSGEVLAAVRAVRAGRIVIPPTVAARLAVHHNSAPLTPRELEVLRQVAAGKANKEIAYELAVSEGTAKTHVAKILQKLRCASQAEAVAVAARRGYLRL